MFTSCMWACVMTVHGRVIGEWRLGESLGVGYRLQVLGVMLLRTSYGQSQVSLACMHASRLDGPREMGWQNGCVETQRRAPTGGTSNRRIRECGPCSQGVVRMIGPQNVSQHNHKATTNPPSVANSHTVSHTHRGSFIALSTLLSDTSARGRAIKADPTV